MLQLRSKDTLDHGDRGWLKARHHFVVSAHGNKANGALGALVVWNDDEVAPGTGFGRHSHADMEIVTYVRQGAVTHEDSAGNVGRTVAGDVQVLSAGTGISHSEHNRDEEALKLFQIWLLPRRGGGEPRWDSRKFPKVDRAGRLVELASGNPKDAETLLIRADARVMGATLLAEPRLRTCRRATGTAISLPPGAWSSSMGNGLRSVTALPPSTSPNSPSRPRRMLNSSSSMPLELTPAQGITPWTLPAIFLS
jgi:redox-sensitive bicupin YhaK (pirin superfamily)